MKLKPHSEGEFVKESLVAAVWCRFVFKIHLIGFYWYDVLTKNASLASEETTDVANISQLWTSVCGNPFSVQANMVLQEVRTWMRKLLSWGRRFHCLTSLSISGKLNKGSQFSPAGETPPSAHRTPVVTPAKFSLRLNSDSPCGQETKWPTAPLEGPSAPTRYYKQAPNMNIFAFSDMRWRSTETRCEIILLEQASFVLSSKQLFSPFSELSCASRLTLCC